MAGTGIDPLRDRAALRRSGEAAGHGGRAGGPGEAEQPADRDRVARAERAFLAHPGLAHSGLAHPGLAHSGARSPVPDTPAADTQPAAPAATPALMPPLAAPASVATAPADAGGEAAAAPQMPADAAAPAAPGAGAATETVGAPGHGLAFVNTYTANVSAAYRNAVLSAEGFFQSHITADVTLNYKFDVLPNGPLGTNSFLGLPVGYADLRNALASRATTADDNAAVASLPITDPSGGNTFFLPLSLEEVLGLVDPSQSNSDTTYLSGNYTYFYDQNHPVAGAYDAVAVLEHEISEGMGRIGGVSVDNNWSILDLFRYSDPQTRDFTDGRDGKNAFFSIDGNTLLTQLHNPYTAAGQFVGGDSGDWEIAGDVFGAAIAGKADTISTTDLREMDILGYSPIASPSTQGGRWIFSAPPAFDGLVLGIDNGVAPVFPQPRSGAFNVEVFTSPTIAGQGAPAPESGFQSSIADANATLDGGFLTGTDLRLGTGDFLAVDSVTGGAGQSASQITLGSGSQTVVGARSDTLVGGTGSQILSVLAGGITVIGGSGSQSVWGGQADSIIAGSGASQQIVVTGNGTTIVSGSTGSATVAAAAQDTVSSFAGSTQSMVIAAAAGDVIDLSGNAAVNGVIGAAGDTITGGGGTTNIEGAAGGMLVRVGAAGTTNLSGSTTEGAGNTVNGGAGGFDFNPGAVAGAGDLIDLSGSAGAATINAFAFGAARVAARDTILATNNADSVFGGDGDRIGTGGGSVVGGTHQWSHADTLAGSAVGFGSNDSVSSTAYNTVAGTAARGNAAGTSSAQVTVGGFATATDFLFYQNEAAATNAAIVATAQATSLGGSPGTVLTLPDGTVMTLVGVSQAQLQAALAAGTLFKA